MAKIISIINNKGGVGKTTSTTIMSQILAILGKKILTVDLDPQGNLSMMFNAHTNDSKEVINGIENAPIPNIHELFKYRLREKKEVEGLLKTTFLDNLHIIPSSKRHKNTQNYISMNETGNNNIILKKALQTIRDDYDFILIDNAPANDILTVNSMFTSDLVLVPVRMEGFSYKGLLETMETILQIKDEHDMESIVFGGVFVTQAEILTNVYKDLKETYEGELGDKFLQTPIRKDIRISEIETNFQPLMEYAPNTNAVFDYSKLILELNILDETDSQTLRNAIGE